MPDTATKFRKLALLAYDKFNLTAYCVEVLTYFFLKHYTFPARG